MHIGTYIYMAYRLYVWDMRDGAATFGYLIRLKRILRCVFESHSILALRSYTLTQNCAHTHTHANVHILLQLQIPAHILFSRRLLNT